MPALHSSGCGRGTRTVHQISNTGRWDDIGLRQVEAIEGEARYSWLWAWKNPRPDRPIASVRIESFDRKFIVAALTMGLVDESPFTRS